MSKLKQPYLLRRDEPCTREFRFARSWSEALGPHASCRREDFTPTTKSSNGWYVSLLCFFLVCYLAVLAVVLIIPINE